MTEIVTLSMRFQRLRKVVLCAAAGIGCAAVLSGSACAGSAHGLMDVRLRLEPGCSFVTDGLDAGLLDFGRTGGSGDPAPLDGMAMARGSLAVIHIACSSSYTGPNAPLLTISRGLHAQGGQRYLLGPDHERIAYDLYADPARRIPLDPSMPRQVAIPVAGVMAEVPIYGRIPRIGDPAAGLYTDVVWLTLSY